MEAGRDGAGEREDWWSVGTVGEAPLFFGCRASQTSQVDGRVSGFRGGLTVLPAVMVLEMGPPPELAIRYLSWR